jgi:hypothetical protein
LAQDRKERQNYPHWHKCQHGQLAQPDGNVRSNHLHSADWQCQCEYSGMMSTFPQDAADTQEYNQQYEKQVSCAAKNLEISVFLVRSGLHSGRP